jgi:hypothetical protein
MTADYKPRFSFEISEEQKQRADRLLETYGLRKAIFGRILDDVLDLIDDYGGVAIGVIMSGATKPRDVIPSMKKAEEVGER